MNQTNVSILFQEDDNPNSSFHLPSNVTEEEFNAHILSNPYLFHKAKIAHETLSILTLSNLSAESAEPIIAIHQREVGHVSSDQYDGKGAILASDSATTCHILALRSYYKSLGGLISNDKRSSILGSMAHIDDDQYDNCIWKMFQEHLLFHKFKGSHLDDDRDHDELSENNPPDPLVLQMDFHLVGGYSDQDFSSVKLTKYILQTLASIAVTQASTVSIKFNTCVVSSLNDTRSYISTKTQMTSGPIARGMALHVASGKVQLLEQIDPSFLGPEYTLRNARLFSHDDDSSRTSSFMTCLNSLLIVHTPRSEQIQIPPFRWGYTNSHLLSLLALPDEWLLKYTSTSPECEMDDYCTKIRNVLRFIRDTSVERVFGTKGEERTLVYKWNPDENNFVSDE